VDDFVPLAVVEGIILFYSGECGVVLDQSWTSDSRLIFDGVEDLIDRKLERDEVIYRFEGLERT